MTLSESLLNVHDAAKAAGRSRSQFYVDIKCGLMVPPIRSGKGARWPAPEIRIINLFRAQQLKRAPRCNCESCKREPDEEIKALVAQLVQDRTGSDPLEIAS
jgi:predicted DNA-binding transcriptional regulator AlpA